MTKSFHPANSSDNNHLRVTNNFESSSVDLLNYAATHAFVMQQIYPAMARQLDHIAFLSPILDLRDSNQRTNGIYSKALLPAAIESTIQSRQSDRGAHINFPTVREIWNERGHWSQELTSAIKEQPHLRQVWDAILSAFESLFRFDLGITPTIAGIIQCLQLELTSLKLNFASRLDIIFTHELRRQALDLYIEANRHYPCICYVSGTVPKFRITKPSDPTVDPQVLSAVLISLTTLATFLVGIPHEPGLSELRDKFTELTQIREHFEARLIPVRTRVKESEFEILTIAIY
jgi:hypothetical protein